MSKKKKDPIAVAMARKRAKKLTPERRSEIAAQAANARWNSSDHKDLEEEPTRNPPKYKA